MTDKNNDEEKAALARAWKKLKAMQDDLETQTALARLNAVAAFNHCLSRALEAIGEGTILAIEHVEEAHLAQPEWAPFNASATALRPVFWADVAEDRILKLGTDMAPFWDALAPILAVIFDLLSAAPSSGSSGGPEYTPGW